MIYNNHNLSRFMTPVLMSIAVLLTERCHGAQEPAGSRGSALAHPARRLKYHTVKQQCQKYLDEYGWYDGDEKELHLLLGTSQACTCTDTDEKHPNPEPVPLDELDLSTLTRAQLCELSPKLAEYTSPLEVITDGWPSYIGAFENSRTILQAKIITIDGLKIQTKDLTNARMCDLESALEHALGVYLDIEKHLADAKYFETNSRILQSAIEAITGMKIQIADWLTNPLATRKFECEDIIFEMDEATKDSREELHVLGLVVEVIEHACELSVENREMMIAHSRRFPEFGDEIPNNALKFLRHIAKQLGIDDRIDSVFWESEDSASEGTQ